MGLSSAHMHSWCLSGVLIVSSYKDTNHIALGPKPCTLILTWSSPKPCLQMQPHSKPWKFILRILGKHNSAWHLYPLKEKIIFKLVYKIKLHPWPIQIWKFKQIFGTRKSSFKKLKRKAPGLHVFIGEFYQTFQVLLFYKLLQRLKMKKNFLIPFMKQE